jgi:molecular chaperone GrpE (heat shock protein)
MAEECLKTSSNDMYLKKIIEVHCQYLKFLKLYEIEEFDPINQPFDPNTSEGLLVIPTPPGYQKNNVATTIMTGYKIKSRLLRSAKVGIFG